MGPDLPGMRCGWVVPFWRISLSGCCLGVVNGGGCPRSGRHIQGHWAHAHQLVSGWAEGLRRGRRRGRRRVRAVPTGIVVRGGRVRVGTDARERRARVVGRWVLAVGAVSRVRVLVRGFTCGQGVTDVAGWHILSRLVGVRGT